MFRPVALVVLVSTGCAPTQAGLAAPDARLPRLPPTRWTAEQQATHLLNRLAFGPSQRDRELLRELGPQRWLAEQLTPGVDPAMEHRLSDFKTLKLSVAEAFAAYPPVPQQLEQAGVDPRSADGAEAKERLRRMLKEHPEALPAQLLVESTQARLLRAALSRRQLEEVLVEFWFNHFNVSAEKNRTRWMVTAYERDAIRPHVFGRFRELLGATAKHPAMLWYLDNWMSTREGFVRPRPHGAPADGEEAAVPRVLGLNENYARELMELHTVGVNAGYAQDDVREAARALTGWSIVVNPRQARFGQFVFHPQAHDQGEKHVFGLTIPAGGGQGDAEALLDHLARHPATARFLARKLCQKFVADEPPPALVERVAAEFLRTDGDLTATYLAIFQSPEFWSDEAFAAKTKTPLEFVVSAVRSVGTLDEVQLPLARALESLGQPLYRCGPPTGWAEVAAPWVSAGALVTRIGFGLRLAEGQVTGVEVELPPVQASPEATLDAVALAVLGRPASPATRATVLRALTAREDDGEQRQVEPRVVAGLLLGSPEFQKQ